MACCTFLPRRGPAARAFTTSFCSMPNSSGEAVAASSSRTERRFSSSATTAAKPSSASAPGATTVSSCSGRRTRRFAALRRLEPVEQICWIRSIASTSSGLDGNSAASGQSAKVHRPAARQSAPDLFGDKRQQGRRHTAHCFKGRVKGVEGVNVLVEEALAAAANIPVGQHVQVAAQFIACTGDVIAVQAGSDVADQVSGVGQKVLVQRVGVAVVAQLRLVSRSHRWQRSCTA
jgi:hypothetical protein